jgi:hypothetical protein
MPSNYTKEIRAGLHKLLSPFQLELTSYFWSQGIKRNCTQAKSMAILSPQGYENLQLYVGVGLPHGWAFCFAKGPHAGRPYYGATLCRPVSITRLGNPWQQVITPYIMPK